MARLIHYATKPMSQYILRPFDQLEPGLKPKGLWITDESDECWATWCKAEEFNLEALACKHLIILKPNANILRLNSALDIIDMKRKYHVDPGYASYSIYYLNWQIITQEYDGIFIMPYQWDARMHEDCFWYYSWDCSSGCIWNIDIIESVTLIKDK